MTRKSVKFPSGLRRGPWKTNLVKRESENKNEPNSILISTSSAERWSNLRTKFRFKSDSELVDYLLTLGEAQPKPSISPDHESDDGWCSSNRTRRKKRGPSLRAVLRRSNRKVGSKSDFLSGTIESAESQTEDSNLSEDDPRRTKKFDDVRSRSAKVVGYDDLSSKKILDSKLDSKRILNSEEEKEAKAHQLDAELALLVESVDLQTPKQNENELYEFKDESHQESSLSCGSPSSGSSNNVSKVSHKRWKSYHKDKRKWKQSYAAVSLNEQDLIKTKSSEEPSSANKSEKERRIFKTLKKNRILTAYLDSQNKIADSSCKEFISSREDSEKVLQREQDEISETETTESSSKKVPESECDGCDENIMIEDGREVQVFESTDVSSGKENQSEATGTTEPVFIEAGERVKLKKRKKKPLQDSDETSSNLNEDAENVVEISSFDIEKQNKLKRNWKKSIINYEHELEEKASVQEQRTDQKPPSEISKTLSDKVQDSHPYDSVTGSVEVKSGWEEKLAEEIRSELSKPMSQDQESRDLDDDAGTVNQCPQCFLRHAHHPCPVLHPLHVVDDPISFEQWQLQCQVQVRCSVIEPPRLKTGRQKKGAGGSPITTDVDKKNKDAENCKSDENTRFYAEESLPMGLGLQVINEEHGRSVIAKSTIAQYTQFGPLVGPQINEKDISDESDMKHIWEVLDGKHSFYINTEDPQKSNWFRFMRPAPEREDRNITLTVRNKQLYFVSVIDIPKGIELLYWADDHITCWSKKKILKSSCGGCNMRFAHPLYYRTHCAVFHDPFHSLTIRKYHCKVCGEAVMGKENIMKHAADLHEGKGAYQCQYCYKFFLRLNYLEMHRTYGCSSNPHRTRPLCDFCGRYFCQPQKLKVHIKRMHSDMSEVLKEFQCKSCLKILGSRAALQRHFKEVHHRDVVVASNCDRCGKSFQNRSNLKIHMLTHSGVKPFKCQQEACSAAFTTKQCLQFHYKKAHGLSEDALPPIERSIAYTFDAYAGEALDGNNKSGKDPVKETPKVPRKNRKVPAKSQKNQNRTVRSEPIECQPELEEAPPVLSIETEVPETNELSKSDQVNHEMKPSHLFTPNAESEDALPHPGTSHGRPLTPTGVITLPYGEEEKQLGNSKVFTPLRTISLQHNAEEIYHPQHANPVIPCHSPSQSPHSHMRSSPSHDLQSVMSLENRGHKKWLGEVIEVAEEAAAAAMRLSPKLSPHLNKRDIYDFDENKVKSKLQYLESPGRLQELQVDMGAGRSKPATALAPFHHPESASLLVEAALDAAERDICCPSLSSKISANPMSRSPEPHQVTHTSYCIRSPHNEEPSSKSFYNTDPSVPAPDHYIMNHSPSSHLHLHPLDSYNIPPSHMSPPRLYAVQSHQLIQHQVLPQGPPSSDDEGAMDSDCNSRGECAQNLSLNVKEKVIERPETSAMYGLPLHHADLPIRSPGYVEHMTHPQQTDLNYSGTMVSSPPRYHLYDLSPDRQRSDVSVADLTVMNRAFPPEYGSFEDMGGSVDLSVHRGHNHGHSLGHDHSHTPLAPSSPGYNTSLAHQYTAPPAPHCVPSYSAHPPAYQHSPLQRQHISSSSNSPSASPSPGPAHFHAYPPPYY